MSLAVQKLDVLNSHQVALNFDSSTMSSSNLTDNFVDLPERNWYVPNKSYMTVDVTAVKGTNGTASIKNNIISLFKRYRVSAGDIEIEVGSDCHIVGRVFDILHSDDANLATGATVTSIGGWVQGKDSHANLSAQQAATTTYIIKFESGFLSSPNPVPLFATPTFRIELEPNTVTEAMIRAGGTPAAPSYSLSNIKYHCHLQVMSPEFNSMFISQLKAGGVDIEYPSIETHFLTLQQATAHQININSLAKSAKSVFFCMRAASNVSSLDLDYSFVRDNLTEFQMQVGNKVTPNTYVKAGGQSFIETMKAANKSIQLISRASISYDDYVDATAGADQKAIYGLDLVSWVNPGSLTGVNLAANKLSIDLRFSGSGNTASNRLYIIIVKDCLLKLQPDGGLMVVK